MSSSNRIGGAGTWLRLTIDRITTIGGNSAAAFLSIMACITTYDVLMRYIFIKPTIWAYEIAHYLLAAVMTWGLAYAIKTEAHITVEVVRERFHYGVRRWLDAVTSLLTAGAVIWLLWSAIVYFMRTLERHEVSRTLLAVPQYLPQIGPLIGFSIFVLMAVMVCVVKWRKAASGSEESDKTREPKISE